MSEHEVSHGSAGVFGPTEDHGRERIVRFPGETYSVTQYNSWYRLFQGRMAQKGLLSTLLRGVADHKHDDDEHARHRANRLGNSALYGHLLASMSETAPDLASEIEETFVDRESGVADGFEAVKYLRARVDVDSYHRNDVLESKIEKLLKEKLPSGCTPDAFRAKAKALRELNNELR